MFTQCLPDDTGPPTCLRSGVSVPGIRMVDVAEGVLGIEWIEGKSVRMLLGGGAEGEADQVLDSEEFYDDMTDASGESLSHVDPLDEYQVTTGASLGPALLAPSD
jgi:TP53 regulating kinase-like protein